MPKGLDRKAKGLFLIAIPIGTQIGQVVESRNEAVISVEGGTVFDRRLILPPGIVIQCPKCKPGLRRGRFKFERILIGNQCLVVFLPDLVQVPQRQSRLYTF